MKNVTSLDAEVAIALFEDIRPNAAVRHQLSVSENRELRDLFESGFEAVKNHVRSFAREDVTRVAMEQSTFTVFRQAIEGNPLRMKTVNRDRETLHAMALRDAYGWSQQFSQSLYAACAMDESQQNKVLEKVRSLEQLGPNTAPRDNTWPAYRDAISLGVANMIMKPVTQEEVDGAARLMSARFGLDGVSLQDSRTDNRQQLRWIEATTKALRDSCNRLGIAETDYGNFGETSLEIMSQAKSDNLGFNGYFQGQQFSGSRIALNLSANDLPEIATHEWAHMLDFALGKKAIELAKATLPESEKTSDLDRLDYFSRLPHNVQMMLPDAKKGLNKVFSALSNESFMTHVDAWIAKNSAADPNVGMTKATQVLEKEASHELAARLDALADRFLLKTVGEQRLLGMSRDDFQALRDDLRSTGDHILIGLSSAMTTSPIGACVFSVCSPDFDGGRPEHPFMAKLKDIHGDAYLLKTMDAVSECNKQFVSTAAMVHAVTRGTLPSKMIEQSIDIDVKRMNSGQDKPYWSQEIELFARAIGRPQNFSSFMSVITADGYLSPASPSQAKDLNEGLAAMSKAAGFQATKKGPDLTMNFERTMSVAALAVRGSVTMATGLLQTLSRRPAEDVAMKSRAAQP